MESPSSSSPLFFLFFSLCVFLASFDRNEYGSMSMLSHFFSPEFRRADILSDSLNVLVLPLPPSRHDDNCSIGTIGGGGRMPDAIAPHACSFNSSADFELALILKEIRFITDQVSSEALRRPLLCPFHGFAREDDGESSSKTTIVARKSG
jgi:hypothetical protein